MSVLCLSGCATLFGIEEARCEGAGCPGVDASTPAPDPTPSSPSTGVGDTGEEPDAAPPELDKEEICAEYCDLVIARCAAAAQQYQTKDGCELLCNAVLEPSADFFNENDRNDTIDCRRNFALAAAAGEVAENCEAAGVYGGGDVCGDRCENYCARMEQFCPEEFEQFDDCSAECASVPEPDDPFDIEDANANTLSCRVYHLQLSVITAQREVHCGHAAGKDGVCADPE